MVNMEMPKVKDFCCGFSLRTGTLIITVLYAISAVIQILWIIFPDSYSRIFPSFFPKVIESGKYEVTGIELWGVWITQIVNLVVSLLGFIGVFMERSMFLIPHMVKRAIDLLAEIITAIVTPFLAVLGKVLPENIKAYQELIEASESRENADENSKPMAVIKILLIISLPSLIGKMILRTINLYHTQMTNGIKASISGQYADGSSGSTIAPIVMTPLYVVWKEIFLLIQIALDVYFLIVVYSYYEKLREGVQDEVKSVNRQESTTSKKP